MLRSSNRRTFLNLAGLAELRLLHLDGCHCRFLAVVNWKFQVSTWRWNQNATEISQEPQHLQLRFICVGIALRR